MAGLSFKGSELLGGSIRQELDALWAEMRRLQPVPGAGQRAEYGPHGVRFTVEDGPPPCDVCDRPGACCILGVCSQLKNGDCLSAGGSWTECARCEPNPCGAPPPPATGACCDAAGACTIETEAACTAAEGTYQGDGVACTPNPCSVPPPPATGACCDADGTCSETTQANCSGTWSSGGSCTPNPCMGICCEYMGSMAGSGGLSYPFCSNALTQETCEAEGSVWHADGVIADCPDCPILGACCAAGQSGGPCTEVTEAACNIIGGHWVLGVHCAPGAQECDNWGACCHNDPHNNSGAPLVCEVTNTGSCSGLLGAYHPFEICDTVNCADDLGTCCSPQYVCADVLATHCLGVGYVWTGGQNCAQNPCVAPPSTGSCCAADGTCSVTTQANCSGTWLSGGNCSPNICAQPATGSCCAPFTNACSAVTQSSCNIISGTWTSGGTCSPDPCVAPPSTGSCCAADGSCSVTTAAACTGTWSSGGSCVPNICAQPTGACCVNGGCFDTTEAACNYNVWYSTPCAQSPCFGSCCNGIDCTNVQAASCLGVFTAFENCTQFTCVYPTGSCCDGAGNCSVTTSANCSGTWSSGGSCTPNPCGGGGTTGACCFFGGTPCQALSSGDCMIFGGMYQGNGTTCAGAGC